MSHKNWTFVRATFQEFFESAQRINAKVNPEIRIIHPTKINLFLERVMRSKKIDDQYKLITCLQLTCGGRVTEILNLKKEDIQEKNGAMRVKIKVLKKPKDSPRIRFGAVAPVCYTLLKQWLSNLSPTDKLFSVSRISVWSMYKTMYGITPHALRHSHITWLHEIKKFDVLDIKNKIVLSDVNVASRYVQTVDDDSWSWNDTPKKEKEEIA